MKTVVVNVRDTVKVMWSNGAGYSLYRVVENEVGPVTFTLLGEYGVISDGGFVKVG